MKTNQSEKQRPQQHAEVLAFCPIRERHGAETYDSVPSVFTSVNTSSTAARGRESSERWDKRLALRYVCFKKDKKAELSYAVVERFYCLIYVEWTDILYYLQFQRISHFSLKASTLLMLMVYTSALLSGLLFKLFAAECQIHLCSAIIARIRRLLCLNCID